MIVQKEADTDETRKEAFIQAAHERYIRHTGQPLQKVKEYMRHYRRDWGDGIDGSEFSDLDDARECGMEAADQALERERS